MNASTAAPIGPKVTPATPKARADWVDAARGAGIILVVYGHVLRSLMLAGTLPDAGIWAAQDHAIYAFHMPLFFLLAGLFAERGILRGRRAFLADKLSTIVWPYLLWSLLNGGLQLAFARHVHEPMTPAMLAGIWWRPIDQFWFLYALLLCQLVAAATLPRIALFGLVTIGGVAAIAFADRPNILFAGAFELPFLFVGVLATRWGVTRADPSRTAIALVAGAGWLVYALALALADPDNLFGRYAVGLAGIVGTAALCMGWLRKVELVKSLGRASMAIYVAHVIVTAGMRIAFERSGLALPPLLALGASTAAGLTLPWLLFAASQRLGWSTMLGLGRRLSAPQPR